MIVAGFGFRKDAKMESLLAALERTGVSRPDLLTTVHAKAEALCLTELADRLQVRIVPVADADLPKATVQTRSQKSEAMYGTGSVSEAAALLAAGPRARLVVPRVISSDTMATCAIAEGMP